MPQPYPWELITSVAEADAVIEFAQLEQQTAQTRIANLNLRSVNSTKSVRDRNAELTEKRAEYNSVVSRQASIADQSSTAWKKLESDKKSLDSDIYDLELSLENTSGVNIIRQRYDANGYEYQLTEANALLAGAQTKKGELQA